MRLQDDNIPLSKEFPFRISTECINTSALPMLHRHECYELDFVKSGEGCFRIGDTDYPMKPGDIYVINNNEYHYSFSEKGMEVLVIIFDTDFIWTNINFDYEYLKPFLERRVYFHNRIKTNNPLSAEIGSLMLEIQKESDEKITFISTGTTVESILSPPSAGFNNELFTSCEHISRIVKHHPVYIFLTYSHLFQLRNNKGECIQRIALRYVVQVVIEITPDIGDQIID